LRFATWEYDLSGRAILSEHADGSEQVVLTYNPNGTTTVIDAAGAERIYHFTVQQGQKKVDHIEGDRCTTCGSGDIQAYTYDSNGFVASKTDWNGNTTTYTRDDQGRELTRTEASGTPQARTITTTWDTTLNKPLTVTEPDRLTEYTYDTEGRLLNRRQSFLQ
jgi:YD repeat-containing protein